MPEAYRGPPTATYPRCYRSNRYPIPGSVMLHPPGDNPRTPGRPTAHLSNRYPIPGSVMKCLGCEGSASSFRLSWAM